MMKKEMAQWYKQVKKRKRIVLNKKEGGKLVEQIHPKNVDIWVQNTNIRDVKKIFLFSKYIQKNMRLLW